MANTVWDKIWGWSHWGTVANFASAAGVVVAIIVAVVSYGQNAQSARLSVNRQANIAAIQMVESHYKFAAEKGIVLSETHTTTATSSKEESRGLSDRESAEELVAQHGLLTGDLAFDLTEQTLEHSEMKGVARFLLERYREDIEQTNFPCQALDDEFVRYARNEVEVNPCQGPLSKD